MKTKSRHTAQSAARIVREQADSAMTRESAAKAVQNLCNGCGKGTPVGYREALHAVSVEMPWLLERPARAW